MPISEREGLFEHAAFAGLRNNVPSERFELPDLEAAENIDLDDSGRATRRFGHGAAVVSGACASLWSDGNIALVVRSGTVLAQIMPDYSVVTLRSGLTPGLEMSYVPMGGRVYYSNGVENGVIESGARLSANPLICVRVPAAVKVMRK